MLIEKHGSLFLNDIILLVTIFWVVLLIRLASAHLITYWKHLIINSTFAKKDGCPHGGFQFLFWGAWLHFLHLFIHCQQSILTIGPSFTVRFRNLWKQILYKLVICTKGFTTKYGMICTHSCKPRYVVICTQGWNQDM